MLKLVGLTFIQSLLLMLSQVFLKLAVTKFGAFRFTADYFKSVFTNLNFAISGLTVLGAVSLWMYILRHYDFSVAYPLGSISYVLGLLAAILVFNESVPVTRWIGVCIIIVGIYFVAK
ncbi:MAG TPA: EamA family transporter [Bacteroidales bacterium]|nr:EamA family transporter [Bacteroidales bacterium]HPT21381.1 EamA family transporter [Bacteroidales bacterium]